jgi:Dolichyl-phosphate-mannose-protein mannosyltransferase
MELSRESSDSARPEYLFLALIAVVMIILHAATNGRYGFHRDELQVLDDARHLDWGFVAYPPMTPFIERVGLALFGTSLVGLRMFSLLAQAAALIVTGLMAFELGGKRLAQIVAALAVLISPLPMFEGTEFQYSSFDYLWSVLIAYFLIRLLKTENPRWWLGVGAMIGVGMMTKYTMVFFVAGVVAGVLLTPVRRYLKSPWLWAGVALSLLIFLPNMIWQIRHHFISLEFLQHIHKRDVGEGRADGFVRDQFMISTNPFTAPIWLAGAYFYFFSAAGKRYRLLGWLFLVPLVLFMVGKGRGYYVAPVYPMLFAAGSVLFESWARSIPAVWSRALQAVLFAGFAIGGAYAAAVIIPFNPVIEAHGFALRNNGDLREEIGFTDLVKAVADVRDSLPPDQRANVAIITGNYGETGAVDLYGPTYSLPQAISGTNTAWYRGYGDPAPQTVIAVGLSRHFLDEHFGTCRLAGHNGNPYGIKNEESEDHPDIYVCGPPRDGWAAFWRDFQRFG